MTSSLQSGQVRSSVAAMPEAGQAAPETYCMEDYEQVHPAGITGRGGGPPLICLKEVRPSR